jgi:hypothetical protein
VNNTVINNTVINNYYTSYSSGQQSYTRSDYTNRSVQGAITAVPHSVFVNSQSVRQEVIQIDRNASTSGEISRLAAVAPNRRSVLGAAANAPAAPPRGRFNREVIARAQPPPALRPFAEREQQLQRKPGLALEPEATTRDRADPARPQHNVRLIREKPGAANARNEQSTQRESATPRKPSHSERTVDTLPDPQRHTVDRGRGQDRSPNQTQPRDRRSSEPTLAVDERSEATRQGATDARTREDDARRQTNEKARRHAASERQADAQRDAAEARGRKDNARRQAQEQGPRQADREQQAADSRPTQEQQRQRNADSGRTPEPRPRAEPSPTTRGQDSRGQNPDQRKDRGSGKADDDGVDHDDTDTRGRRGADKKSD